MTDVDELVYDRLSADETLLETLTGGVYFSDNLPREGLTQDVVPEAQLKLPRAVELGNAVSLRLDYLSIAYKGTLV
jgi:hypothetical protein